MNINTPSIGPHRRLNSVNNASHLAFVILHRSFGALRFSDRTNEHTSPRFALLGGDMDTKAGHVTRLLFHTFSHHVHRRFQVKNT